MRAFFQNPLSWLALFCAVSSAGLWEWSRGLPDSNWETTTAALSASAARETAPSKNPPPAGPTADNGSGETAPASASVPEVAETSPAQPAPAPASETAAVAPAAPAPEPPSAQPSPTPSDAALAGLLPTQSEPVAPAAPPPVAAPNENILPPAPLDFTDIARQPALWPRQIVLRASVRFPVILNGVNVGNIQMPPGRVVQLRKVNPDGTVEIELQGSQAGHVNVQAEKTDLLARAQALAVTRKSVAP